MTDLTGLRLRGALRLLALVMLIVVASVVTHVLVCECCRGSVIRHIAPIVDMLP